MSALAAAGRRVLPKGWADFGRQLAIWFGFLAAYQAARGIADRDPPRAFDNGLHVIGIERHAHALIELTLQRVVDGSHLLANVIGLVGYVLLPTAPPRMFPDLGFADTLADFGGLNHGSGLVEVVSNPYAAMPSLHAADAVIVGVVLFMVCRRPVFKALWLLWPLWVWFSVMATGNHFWLDVLAGVVVALVALAVVYGRDLRRRRLRPAAA